MVNVAAINAVHRLLPGEEPYAALGGSNLWLSGYVVDDGQEVTRVLLVSSNGNILEDPVQDGLVVFAPEQGIPLPIQVELYNSAGNLVNTHLWPYISPNLRSHFPEYRSGSWPFSLTTRLISAAFSSSSPKDQAPGQEKTSPDPDEPPEC